MNVKVKFIGEKTVKIPKEIYRKYPSESGTIVYEHQYRYNYTDVVVTHNDGGMSFKTSKVAWDNDPWPEDYILGKGEYKCTKKDIMCYR